MSCSWPMARDRKRAQWLLDQSTKVGRNEHRKTTHHFSFLCDTKSNAAHLSVLIKRDSFWPALGKMSSLHTKEIHSSFSLSKPGDVQVVIHFSITNLVLCQGTSTFSLISLFLLLIIVQICARHLYFRVWGLLFVWYWIFFSLLFVHSIFAKYTYIHSVDILYGFIISLDHLEAFSN